MVKDKETFTKYWKDKINKVNSENYLLESRVKELESDVKYLKDILKNHFDIKCTINTNTIQVPKTEIPVKQDSPLKYNVIWVQIDYKTHEIKSWIGFDSVREASVYCRVKESTVRSSMEHYYKIIGTYTFMKPLEFFNDYFSKGVLVISDELFPDYLKLEAGYNC